VINIDTVDTGPFLSTLRKKRLPADLQILILCVGNILLLDEGFGPRVAEQLLAKHSFPPQVTVLDRGVMGLAIIADLRNATDVLIVDALDNTGEAPGTIMRYQPADLDDHHIWQGAHDTRLVDVINAASILGISPRFSCLGVQVQDISPPDFQIGLSPAVEAAIDPMIELILDWVSATLG
jgi:hydrogenase maturation protease